MSWAIPNGSSYKRFEEMNYLRQLKMPYAKIGERYGMTARQVSFVIRKGFSVVQKYVDEQSKRA